MGLTENKMVTVNITISMGMNLSKLQETDSEGQGSQVCHSSWGFKELDMTV